ncbi:MAG: hypothetical protein OQL08_01495 [Gammaproteobacteria bacterium]|nr:hypothetical protein [Gammaproteobacteria bacterium]
MNGPFQRAWSNEIGQRLAPALGDDLAEIRRQVMTGQAMLVEWPEFGLTVLRMEHPATQPPILVVVAAVGFDMASSLPGLADLAHKNGAQRIRAHVKKPGMEKLLNRLGFTRGESVFFRDIRGFIDGRIV